jgi:transcriptional regulator with XRE-family HTH domain
MTTMKSKKVPKAFGKVLRAARQHRGLSQEGLAEIADMDRTYPSLLERGLRTPTLTVIITLAFAIKTTPAQLVDDTFAALQEAKL